MFNSIAFRFTRLRAQFIKEVLSILRDPRSRMVVFAPPMLQLLVFAFAATLEVRNVDIAVHNQDAGRWSNELMQRLDSADFITHVRHVTASQELRAYRPRQGDRRARYPRRLLARHCRRRQRQRPGAGRWPAQQLRADHRGLSVRHRCRGRRRGQRRRRKPATPVSRAQLVQSQPDYRWFIVPGLSGILALLQRADDHFAVDRP
jgi:ABC-2 type transport system permease protein